MRILHTSDWHLGRILHGIHLTEDQQYILKEFVQIAKESNPDVIIIAGDIYDRSVPPVEAVELLDDVFTEILIELEIPIITIAGNHDSADRINFGSKLLKEKGLYISGKIDSGFEPVVINDEYGPVYFYTLPYCDPAIVKEITGKEEIRNHNDAMASLIDSIKENLDTSKRNVLIGHAFVIGGESSESERPLSVGGSGYVDWSNFKDFNYTALGHLHRPQRAGDEKIRYSGSLMKYSFSEANHNKAIYLIDMDQNGDIVINDYTLKPKRDLRCIEGYLDDLIKEGLESDNTNDYILVSLLDEGAILDPMGKLRKVYPKVLRIERKNIKNINQNNIKTPGKDYNKLSYNELFKSFYSQVTVEDFNNEKEEVFNEIIKDLLKGEK